MSATPTVLIARPGCRYITTFSEFLAVAGRQVDGIVHAQSDQQNGNDLTDLIERPDDLEVARSQQHPDALLPGDGHQDDAHGEQDVGTAPAECADQGQSPFGPEKVHEAEDGEDDGDGEHEEAADLRQEVGVLPEEQSKAERGNADVVAGLDGSQRFAQLNLQIDELAEGLIPVAEL